MMVFHPKHPGKTNHYNLKGLAILAILEYTFPIHHFGYKLLDSNILQSICNVL
jgi:hypothetical protein